MSVKTYTDPTTRIITKTIEEHVWRIRCNAIGCNNSLEFRENQDTGDITADGDFRAYIYAMSLKRLKRKCEKYANRERKAIAYVATLKEES